MLKLYGNIFGYLFSLKVHRPDSKTVWWIFGHCSSKKMFRLENYDDFWIEECGCDNIETGSFFNSMSMTFCVHSDCLVI